MQDREGIQRSIFRRYLENPKVRYVQVGIFNTVFGYSLFAGFTALFESRIPYSYLFASLVSNLIAITASFLGYKWFVFKTRGNYLREWVKSLAVYSGGFFLGLILLPVMVTVLRNFFGFEHAAPYIAGAFLVAINVVLGFLGHKYISFRGPRN
jgi:putative flippase GtrA